MPTVLAYSADPTWPNKFEHFFPLQPIEIALSHESLWLVQHGSQCPLITGGMWPTWGREAASSQQVPAAHQRLDYQLPATPPRDASKLPSLFFWRLMKQQIDQQADKWWLNVTNHCYEWVMILSASLNISSNDTEHQRWSWRNRVHRGLSLLARSSLSNGFLRLLQAGGQDGTAVVWNRSFMLEPGVTWLVLLEIIICYQVQIM